MLTGFLDQPAQVVALPPLHDLHVGELVQFELGVEDDVLLVGPELPGSCGIPAMAGEPQGEQALGVVPIEACADAHHSIAELEAAEVVPKGALNP